ncbi:MAG: glucose-1-phosphate cytidylyltransferase [Thermoanaerobaculia bacterium]|nr:glucose-1-phosphate cytidylyltransferase [Thermoanaerobaculia bacterium]
MKVVILAGGYGTRISEESSIRPKPMVEIGGMPIMWHIMKTYAAHGLTEFVICCGYKGHMIRDYFLNYRKNMSDVTVDLATGDAEVVVDKSEPWKVTLVDTGLETMTGGRLRRIRRYVEDGTFCVTYGDGVGSMDITAEIEFHRQHGKLVTLTAVQPPGRFGAFHLHPGQEGIEQFKEKPSPTSDSAWVNGGYFVVEPAALDYIDGDDTVWERDPLENLARDGELMAWRHTTYWQNMDTLRDMHVLEDEWNTGSPRWKIW